MRRALVIAGIGLTAVLIAPGAGAHNATAKLGYRATIRAVKPPMRGLKLKILYGDDQVWLDNTTGETVIVEGYGGEPYLRFSPDGIYANVNSPAGYLNQDRFAQAEVPKSATANARPNWHKLAGGDVFEAYLPARRLQGDYYELNDLGTALVGRRGGRRYRLGDELDVKVEDIRRSEGKVEVSSPSSGESRGGARRGRPSQRRSGSRAR